MGDRCGVWSKPMLDLSLSKRVSILNGWGNNTVSSMDIREFFMLRRMPVNQWKPRCQRRTRKGLER